MTDGHAPTHAGADAPAPVRRVARGRGRSRAVLAREARRTRLFARFRLAELNLVPLVDTFVSIVFFALTAATVGELTPVARGVTLPTSRVGNAALQELTVGVSPAGMTVGTRLVVPAAEMAALGGAGASREVPALGAALRAAADSIRTQRALPAAAPLPVPLAIQGDRAVRYAVLARVMQTARAAGFTQLTLQVRRAEGATP